MKIVNVNNLNLQFEVEDGIDINEEMVEAYVDLINGTMSNMFHTSQPAMVKQHDTKVTVIEITNFLNKNIMTRFMTIDEVVSAAHNDAARQSSKGTLNENVDAIASVYSQWAEDQMEAEDAIWTMFREKFSNF